MSGSYRSESQYNAPTTEADLDTQTGKEESCALKEKNTKLAYSAKRDSQEWTVTTSRCFWHYVSNNIEYGGAAVGH